MGHSEANLSSFCSTWKVPDAFLAAIWFFSTTHFLFEVFLTFGKVNARSPSGEPLFSLQDETCAVVLNWHPRIIFDLTDATKCNYCFLPRSPVLPDVCEIFSSADGRGVFLFFFVKELFIYRAITYFVLKESCFLPKAITANHPLIT